MSEDPDLRIGSITQFFWLSTQFEWLRFLLPFQFNDIINVIFSSKAFVAAIVAYFLDNTLHRGDSAVRRDRGYHFWDRFRSFKTDSRSEEFYSLPFNLDKFFPSI